MAKKLVRALGTPITQCGTRVRAPRNYGEAWAKKAPVRQRTESESGSSFVNRLPPGWGRNGI